MAMKKTILQIFASSGWGGGEQYVYDLSERLTKDGYSVLFAGKKCPFQKKKVSPKKLYTLPFKGVIDLYSPFKLHSIIKKNKVDIVHIHQFKDAFTTMLTKLLFRDKFKVVLTRHLVKKAKNSFLYTKAYQSVDKMIFVSELAKNTFLSTQPKVDIGKIEVVHNSVTSIKPINELANDYRQTYSISASDIILLFTGRLVKEKGLDVLLRALPKLSTQSYKLLVAGTGDESYTKQLHELAESLGVGDKAVFLGFVEDIADLIHQADIGVMPSVWQEPFGLAALEYMRDAKPVITTNNGAQKEFMEDGVNGILIPPDNTDELAMAINDLMTNGQKRKLIGQNAKKHFDENLNYEQFYGRIIRIYDSA